MDKKSLQRLEVMKHLEHFGFHEMSIYYGVNLDFLRGEKKIMVLAGLMVMVADYVIEAAENLPSSHTEAEWENILKKLSK